MSTRARAAGKPFGPYENFEACVADNQDKEDPEAFCSALEEAIAEATDVEEEDVSTSSKRDVDDTRQMLQAALRDKFDDRVWVHTFDPQEGFVVYESGEDMSLYKLFYEDSGGSDGILLSEDEPVEVERETETRYVEKGKQRGELTGPIVLKDAKKHIAYAAVLVPGEPDSDGETLTAEKIEEVAHGWMETYRNIDLQHSLNNLDALPVESHILRQSESVNVGNETLTLPKGTWVLASKFNDDATWVAIEKGQYQGYSVMGVQRAVVKEAATKSQSFAFKKTLLGDLGEDWIATHVSVVDEPAVPKAKWFALKAAKPSFGDRFRDMFAAKEGRKFSEKTYKALKAAHSALGDLIKEADKERDSKAKNRQSDNGKIGGKTVKVDPHEFKSTYKSLLERSDNG